MERTSTEDNSPVGTLDTQSVASATSTLDTGIGSASGTEFDMEQEPEDLLASIGTESLGLSTVSDDNQSSGLVSDASISYDEGEETEDPGTSCSTDDMFRKMRLRSQSDPGHAVDTSDYPAHAVAKDSEADERSRQTHSPHSESTTRKSSDALSEDLEGELTHENDSFRTESILTQEVKLLVERSLQIDAVACVGVPLVHCVRLMCSFLLSGHPGEMLPDSSVRVSVKSLALACVAQAVRLYPEAFLGRVLPESGEDAKQNWSDQLVRDILLYIQHSDPQLRGALAFVIANFIGAGMQKSRWV